MELIEGRSLTEHMAQSRLPIKEALDIAAQMADALAAAHDAGVVHRDLKPQNIMITAEGRAKMVDFGLSKIAPPPATGNRRNHSGRRADRRLRGARHRRLHGARTGVVVAGRRPHRSVRARRDPLRNAGRPQGVPTRHRPCRRCRRSWRMSRRRLPRLRPDVPPAAVSIVGRCLAKRPERRYASTRDLAHNLRDATNSRPRQPIRIRSPAAASPGVAMGRGRGGWRCRPGARRRGWPRTWRAGDPTSPPRRLAPHRRDAVHERDERCRRSSVRRGLAETLTSALTQLERYQRLFRVVPASEVRTSRIESIRDAQQAFGATLAISGSIQRLPSTLRLTLNLVDAVKLVQLGSRTIDIMLADGVLTQDTVADAATALLTLELEPAERRDAGRGRHIGAGRVRAVRAGPRISVPIRSRRREH